jgi:hypothetical protein
MELDWPLVSLEPFLFVGRAALDRLCLRLEGCGFACARLELALRLDPHGHDERSLVLPAPTREAKTLLTLVKLDLERRPPGAAVVGFTFTAHPDRPREAQLTLFGPAALSPDKLVTTLARLFSLLGASRIGSPRTVDGHRPERCALVDYSPPPPPEMRPSAPAHRAAGLLVVRVLRPPVPIEVQVEPSGTPVEIRSEVGGTSESTPNSSASIAGQVRVASGPWRVEEGWWSEQAIERDYWDVEISDGGVYRIFRDRLTGAWHADGIYD